jgi:hypothetical protein
MNGTLALWFEQVPHPRGEEPAGLPVGPVPTIRLHVNLWRDLDKDFNFLDVGFLMGDVGTLGRLYLYLPGPIETDSIFDLSNVLKDADTLNAVFNEVVQIEREEDSYFITSGSSAGFRVIHLIDPTNDIAINAVNVSGHGIGTIIALNSGLCDRIRNAQSAGSEQYVRLRIFLRGPVRNLFTNEDTTPGVGLALTQDVMETTEFRLNERRSYPSEVLRRATRGQVILQSVHYFLIRSKNYQLGSQHQNFRKVRYLEHDIWNSYIAVGQPRRRTGMTRADGMIIYQWREVAKEGESLDDFIAYASFRMVRPKILAYLVAILAIGGVGGAILNVGIAALGRTFDWAGWARPSEGYANLWAGVALGILALLPMGVARVRQWWRK